MIIFLYYFFLSMNWLIKFFNQTKGFGFIIQDNGDEELFLHITACAEGYEPQEGDRVSYEVGEGRKGPMAVNVDALRDEDGNTIQVEQENDMDMAA